MDLIELVQTREFNRGLGRFLKLLSNYFRVEVEGLEHIPRKGSAIICPNHSGFAGTDAVLLAHLIQKHTGRLPRIMAHRAFFDISRRAKAVAEVLGLRKASIENGVEIMNSGELMILFPEGEKGNFKPTLKRYHLQDFHTGFLRIAIPSGAPIIPCIVIGAEESHLNWGNINLSRLIKGMRIPIPLTLIPLPAKWKVRFLPPIETKALAKEDLLGDKEQIKAVAKRVRRDVQRAINQELRNRPFVYSTPTRRVADRLEKLIRNRLKGA